MRAINKLVIHCTDTYHYMDIGLAEVKKWHTDPKPNGNGWRDVGYHLIVRRDGTIEQGRKFDEVPACVAGHNLDSYCVAWVGGKCMTGGEDDNRTIEQKKALANIVQVFRNIYPDIEILGHRDLDPGKYCPSFDVRQWLNTL